MPHCPPPSFTRVHLQANVYRTIQHITLEPSASSCFFNVQVASILFPFHIHGIVLLSVLSCLTNELVYALFFECNRQTLVVFLEQVGTFVVVRLALQVLLAVPLKEALIVPFLDFIAFRC